jgi:hypothetical protein
VYIIVIFEYFVTTTNTLFHRSIRRFWTRKWLKRRYFGRGLSSLFFEELAVEDKEFQKFYKNVNKNFGGLAS